MTTGMDNKKLDSALLAKWLDEAWLSSMVFGTLSVICWVGIVAALAVGSAGYGWHWLAFAVVGGLAFSFATQVIRTLIVCAYSLREASNRKA